MTIGDGVHSWSLPPTLEAATLSEHVPRPIAQVLVRRGIDTLQKLNTLLNPPHRLHYDPLRIAGMDIALQRLHYAVTKREQVGVFGDFDVDGRLDLAVAVSGSATSPTINSTSSPSRWARSPA